MRDSIFIYWDFPAASWRRCACTSENVDGRLRRRIPKVKQYICAAKFIFIPGEYHLSDVVTVQTSAGGC